MIWYFFYLKRMSDISKRKLNNKLITTSGALCLALYFILDRYTETPDFVLGIFIGVSIGLSLAGAFTMIANMGNRKSKLNENVNS